MRYFRKEIREREKVRGGILYQWVHRSFPLGGIRVHFDCVLLAKMNVIWSGFGLYKHNFILRTQYYNWPCHFPSWAGFTHPTLSFVLCVNVAVDVRRVIASLKDASSSTYLKSVCPGWDIWETLRDIWDIWETEGWNTTKSIQMWTEKLFRNIPIRHKIPQIPINDHSRTI